MIISMIIVTYISESATDVSKYFGEIISAILGILNLLLIIALIWIMYCSIIERSHDIGNSGWYILIPFYNIFLLFMPGDNFTNKYGKIPGTEDDLNDTFENENLNDKTYICPHCEAEVELEDYELAEKQYICPECNKLVLIK